MNETIMMEKDVIQMTDGYKLDHRRQNPSDTEFVYSNFTPRSSRIVGADRVPFIGLRPFCIEFLDQQMNATFWSKSRREVCDRYQEMLDQYLGPTNGIGTDHIGSLWDYKRMPLEFCALPEGTLVPYRIPMFTVENTHRDFPWLTNYFETLISSEIWLPCTSAMTARRFRRLLDQYATLTGARPEGVQWQGHDFSFRGMASWRAAALSGAGHLMSFTGTDTLPAIQLLKRFYLCDEIVGMSVPATEHSVACANGPMNEESFLKRLLTETYPKGYVSFVSDTWDLWMILGKTLPNLKSLIMSRDGKLVIRPDSGDPVKILTGDSSAKPDSLAYIGVVESLWNTFGGITNAKGYKELDPHIGAIYGDAITLERADQICQRLMDKGFASSNVVLGIGSFTYQYATRDVHGFALKATWAQVRGHERMLQKDPVTDDGTKKSATGRLVVCDNEGRLDLIQGLTKEEQGMYNTVNLLKPVWREGHCIGPAPRLSEMRKRVRG